MPAVINTPYNQQLTGSGGTAPYVFSLKSGSPPPGITLSPDGLLSGTPTLIGTSNFTVQAVDGYNGYGERNYDLEVVGGNEIDATIAGTNPFLDYLADEASGQYISNGSSPLAIEIDPQFGNTDIWRQAPGVIRTTPIQYSFMAATTQITSGWSNPTAGDANLPAIAGYTTGAFNCFIIHFGIGKDLQWAPMSLSWNTGNTVVGRGQAVSLEVNENGRLFFLIGTNPTGSVGGSGIRIETGDGVIQRGTPYMISAVQRADGTGIQILINGVVQAVTRTIGTNPTLNIDSWIDDWGSVTTNDTEQFFVINGWANGLISSYGYAENSHGLVQRPCVWRNNPPSDATFLDIFNAAAFTNPITDYCEFLIDRYVATQDAYQLTLGWLNTTELNNWAFDVQEVNSPLSGTHGRWQWGSTRQSTNVLDTFRQSRWPLYRSQFDVNNVGGQFITSGGSSQQNLMTTGTINLVLELPASIAIGQNRPIFAWGEGISGPDENVGIFLAGNSFGTSVVWLIGEFTSTAVTTGDFFRRTYAAADVGLALADFPDARFMLTFTQDGVNGIQLYMNGQPVNVFADSSGGVTFDEDGWFEQLVSPGGSLNMSVGYPGSSAHADNMWVSEAMVLTDRVLTAQEVLDHWNAVNGSF